MSIAFGQEKKSFERKFTLAEDIDAEKVVKLRSDGQIEEVFGGPFEFSAAFGNSAEVVEIGTDRFLIVYLTNTSELAVVVATVDSRLITFGSEFAVGTSLSSPVSAAKLDTDKVLISYKNQVSLQSELIVAVVTGDNVAFGSPFAFPTTLASDSVLSLGVNQAIVSLKDNTNNRSPIGGALAVVTTVGDVISVGTEVFFNATFPNSSSSIVTLVSVAVNKILIFYHQGSNEIFSLVGTVGASGITYGSEESLVTESFSLSFSSDKLDAFKALLSYGGKFGDTQLVVVTVDATDFVTFATPVGFNFGSNMVITSLDVDKATAVHLDGGNVVSVSGTTITVGPIAPFNVLRAENRSVATVSSGKIIMAQAGNAHIGVIDNINLTFDTRNEFLGILKESGLAGEEKEVHVDGTFFPAAPIVPGKYQVSRVATIEPVSASPGIQVIIGKAISITELLITN